MEAKAKEALAVLKNSNLSLDAKVTQILGLKSDIKQKNVPPAAKDALFECLRLAIASPHYQLLAAGFSMLGHLIKRLFVQDEHQTVAEQAYQLYGSLVERMGDHKDRVRAHAAQAFTDLWPADGPQVEYQVLEVALTGKNPRAKESSLVWLADMANTRDMLFRAYVPTVVACLEDADPTVRETAKTTVIELFKDAPSHAQLDLKRQLASVRKTIAHTVLSGIGLEEELPATRPPSRGDVLRRPPSRGEALRRPPSRGDALQQRPDSALVVQRPHSRGDTLIRRPETSLAVQRFPSKGEVLHHQRPESALAVQRPPSRGDALHQRPDAIQVFQQRPDPVETYHQRPPSRGVALHSSSELVVFAPAEQIDESYEQDTPVIVRPTPVRPNNSKRDQEKAPRAAASVDRRFVPTSPRYPTREADMVQPREVASAREYEQIYREMLPCFEGVEKDTNWLKREKNIIMLRRITHGNAPRDFPDAFIDGIKILLDSIFKVALSLRTSMQTNGMLLLQDLARICQHQLDPIIDIILHNSLKLCGTAKKITSHNGDATVTTLLENVTLNTRLLTHITTAASSNILNLRIFSAGWLIVVINNQARHKTAPEGVKSIGETIKKNLTDASPVVREQYRATFWAYYGVWQTRASKLLDALDPKVRASLEKDPHNPANDPFVVSSTPTKAGPTRPTLKGTRPAGMKVGQAVAKCKPPPPKADQTALPDATSINRQPKQPISRPAAAATQNTSSLSSAPMRPGAAKPRPPPLEISRPATATGFRPTQVESPIHNTPTRIPVATPSTRPPGSIRPRQKSDPSQDASPTKMRARMIDHRASLEPPFGTLTLPKKRSRDTHAHITENVTAHPVSPTLLPVASLVAPVRVPVEARVEARIEAPVEAPVEAPLKHRLKHQSKHHRSTSRSTSRSTG
ncbi:clasp N terminal-domain-containing protein [Aspergillus spectabilis]